VGDLQVGGLRTFTVLGVVGRSESRSTRAAVVVDEVFTITERFTRKLGAFVKFCTRTALSSCISQSLGLEENHGFTITVNTVILTEYRNLTQSP